MNENGGCEIRIWEFYHCRKGRLSKNELFWSVLIPAAVAHEFAIEKGNIADTHCSSVFFGSKSAELRNQEMPAERF